MTRVEFRDHISKVLQDELHKVSEESDFCVPFMIDGPYPTQFVEHYGDGPHEQGIERFIISIWLSEKEHGQE